jgi:hypothetical protein
MQTQSSKYQAVKTLAKIRGIKEFSPEEMNMITELCDTELSARDILDEVTDAPSHRIERTQKALRTHASNALGKLAEALKPRD